MRTIDSIIVEAIILKKQLKEKIAIKVNLLKNDKLSTETARILREYKVYTINIRGALSRVEMNPVVVEYVEGLIEDYIEFVDSIDSLFNSRK